jgi:hypothetical protein
MPVQPLITCQGTIGQDGRCLGCGVIVFARMFRRTRKPAQRDGLLPAGIRRHRKKERR